MTVRAFGRILLAFNFASWMTVYAREIGTAGGRVPDMPERVRRSILVTVTGCAGSVAVARQVHVVAAYTGRITR